MRTTRKFDNSCPFFLYTKLLFQRMIRGIWMENLVEWLVGQVWSIGLVVFALGAGVYFTIATRFLQIRYFKEMIKLLFEGKSSETGISSFQAFCLALSGRVGIGNIAGVATAIAFGGTPYFIEKGLKMKWFAVIVAVVVTLSYGVLLPGIQSSSIAVGFENSNGISKYITGIFLVMLLAAIIFGGVKRIAGVSQMLVPFMAIGYVIVTCIILIANVTEIPRMFALIFSSAFGVNEMFGGIVGAAIAWGVKRAVFSNVAGVGEATYSSAAAEVSHPAKQGLVQAFSVYIDTIVVCTATALMILITGMYNVIPEGKTAIVQNIGNVEAGPIYTQQAVETVITGFGPIFISIAIFFFAFTTLLAYYYIAETTLTYLDRQLKYGWLKPVLKFGFLIMVYIGSVESASLLWNLGDLGIGSMAWLNLIAILLLSKTALKVLKDYETQKKEGKDPVFNPKNVGIEGLTFWEERSKEVERKSYCR